MARAAGAAGAGSAAGGHPRPRRPVDGAPGEAGSRRRLGDAPRERPRRMTSERDAAVAEFLSASGWSGVTPVSLAGDASFRRYYRLGDGERRVVLMDAPPPMEDVRPY